VVLDRSDKFLENPGRRKGVKNYKHDDKYPQLTIQIGCQRLKLRSLGGDFFPYFHDDRTIFFEE
jgi:hypothetical protein